MYVRREIIDKLEPTVTGWFAHKNQFQFDPSELVYKDDAGRFESGTPSVAAVYAGAEGLRMINELGVISIRDRTSDLTSRLVKGLLAEGFTLRAPEDGDKHASITMVEMADPTAMVAEMASKAIVIDSRPGAVRLSPYFYNTTEDIDSAVQAMTEIRRSLEM